MDADAPRGLLRYFQDIDDPRHHNVHHRLSDILAIAILAVICGAENWPEVAHFGRCKLAWLKTFLPLPRDIPSHDTFGRVFAMLDPAQLERCFTRWTGALAERPEGRLIAADGKTIRRSFDRADDRAAIHMVSAWCEANQLVLGQWAAEARSNEITALPELLATLELRGAVVTVDAMNSQKATAAQIIDQGGDYLMPIKGNHGKLHEQVKLTLDEMIALERDGLERPPLSFARSTDGGHGRVEVRRLWCTPDVSWTPGRDQWKGLSSVAVLETVRERGGARSVERRYYLSSLSGEDAAGMLAAARGHWGVENKLHWSLDVSFGEDNSRVRIGHAAENLSRLRRLALNLLSRDKSVRAGKRAKSKICSWDHDYLLHILTQP